MSTFDTQEFGKIVGYCCQYKTAKEITYILKSFTNVLNIGSDSDWKHLCRQLDPRHCIEYLTNSLDEKIESNGTILRTCDPSDVTLERITKAFYAKVPLTISMIKNNKVLRNTITNEWIVEHFLKPSGLPNTKIFPKTVIYYDMFNLWKKKGKSLKELWKDKSIEEWFDLTNLPLVCQLKRVNQTYNTQTSIPEYYFKGYVNMLKCVGIPKEILQAADLVIDFYKRYMKMEDDFYKSTASLDWKERQYKHRPYVPLFEDEEMENECKAISKLLNLYNDTNGYAFNSGGGWTDQFNAARILIYYLKLKAKKEQ